MRRSLREDAVSVFGEDGSNERALTELVRQEDGRLEAVVVDATRCS